MKVICDAEKLYKAIGNSEDREKFQKKYGDLNRFKNGIFVELPDHKTQTQLGTVWRDWTIAGKLLGMSENAVYFKLMKSRECLDIWFKKDENGNWEFKTLSRLTKEETARLIERYRAVLQNWVDEEHAEHIEINWSCQENISKPDYERIKHHFDGEEI